MPRPPKPTALRANRERRDLGIVPSSLTRPSTQPDPPSRLLKETRDSWTAYWSSPLAAVIVPATDLPALTRLWQLYDERIRMYRAIRKERIVLGSQGQPRANPLYAQMRSLDAEVRQLEDRFGLSPKSRLELGVVLGDAARSLADLNAELEEDELDPDERPDPRLLIMDRR